MRYYRCKCGEHEFFGSGMTPQPCQGCSKCGTTLAGSANDHRTPVPHDWKPDWQIDSATGKKGYRERCSRCYKTRDGVAPEPAI